MARNREPRHTGILLVDKPAGPTSHDVVGWVRWALGERSVGHCGTLDPGATGLLVICVGEATKLVEQLTGVDKRYLARFVLGRSTNTADAQGETLEEAPVSAAALAEAGTVLGQLRGPLELPPPVFSAIRLAGKRAHAMARAGEAPELAPRSMVVRALSVGARGQQGDLAWIEADLTVAKGTYIRSLAEELGRRLGLPAHLGTLRRLACGPLCVDDSRAVGGLVARELASNPGQAPRWRVALPPELSETAAPAPAPEPEQNDLEPRGAQARADAHLQAHMDPPWARMPFPSVILRGEGHGPAVDKLLQGQRLPLTGGLRAALGSLAEGEGRCALIDPIRGRMIVAERAGGRLAPSRVLRLVVQA